jgi:release factor glutamine methyltransferase
LQKKLSKSEQYSPAEDTFFLTDCIQNECGQAALDIGTGSGYLARVLSEKFSLVVATDVDFFSLASQKKKIPNSVCCNGADAIGVKFDLIVCNMPYLPSDEVSDRTVDGGKEGLEIPLEIIKSSKKCLKKDGKFMCLTSSLANYTKLSEQIKNLGFSINQIARKKLFFEELILIELKLQ